ncbi:polysaccharide deacetylase [Pseudorhizobium endolithicum]|uniref:Polysaccharide deacetylase n=1 Tax=Pseudorhizobium endolithicum TaxID=1191678 RepID=A0ABM8PEN5_9HYPH|nr:polysaccharide deacetylase [Pseudorhizobium endolithicum]CAD7024692.1 polysaccharide deacetylase [Pseudorhizobium endolithicum]
MLYRFFLCLALGLCLPALSLASEPDRTRQLLLISFDGAGDNALWQRSRNFARTAQVRFTYFLSCSLVIAREDAGLYKGPHHKAGRSNIGFAQTREEARTRLFHVWQAHQEGHEIASHTCGHFDGADWSVSDWKAEMQSFRSILSGAWAANDAATEEPEDWRKFVAGIEGFRAPYLSAPASLFEAERREGFVYDASTVTKGPLHPSEKGGVLAFGLPLIPEGPKGRPIIAMDYNLFIRHSAGVENPSRSAEFEERAYAAFRAAFDRQYEGDRIPLQIGLHFVRMNGGAYWRAMERLVTEVCGRQDVGCVTYREALQELGSHAADSSGL